MGKVSLQRKEDIKQNFIDGLSRYELLAGATEEVKIFRCTLKAGTKWVPQQYAYGEKVQWFFFLNPSGYVGTAECAEFQEQPIILSIPSSTIYTLKSARYSA